jgi:hypothetical protein
VRIGRSGLVGIGLSTACFLVTALLGPSAMEPDLAGTGPPFALAAHPAPHLVIGLVAAGVLLAGLGLGLCLRAVHRGWRPAPRPLLIAGLLATAAFAFLPPIGSADHLNYAAYGRMVVTGHDPYTTRAVDLPADPIAQAVQEWRTAPSVYGPIATGQQALASWIGGESVRLTVFVLSLTGALAFALVGLVLYRYGDPLRSVLFWTLNPLMLFHLVAGAHNDTLAVAVAVLALAVFTGPAGGRIEDGQTGGTGSDGSVGVLRALATGALVGAGAAIKLPAALVGGGPAWVLLRRKAFAPLAALVGGAAATALLLYLPVGLHAFDQVRRASNSVSFATPWHLVDAALGVNRHRPIIQIGSLLLLVALTVLLARALPSDAAPAPKGCERAFREPAQLSRSAARPISTALVLAWLFAAPYALPWYDGLGWAVLALLPWSRFDWLLPARTVALSLAYLPARAPDVIKLPDDLSWLFTVVRPVIIPWVLTAVLIALVVQAVRDHRPAPGPVRTPRARAGSPG